jgi:predicted aspartyl protease
MLPDDRQPVTAARARVAFRLAGDAQPLLLLPVQVNDRGPFQFVLDTGAGTTLLAPALARSLGVQSTGTRQGQTAGGAVDVSLAVVDSLGVGALRRAKLNVAILDLSRISQAIGTPLDGDLGYNFLKDFRLTIDFQTAEVRLDDPKRCEHFGPGPLVERPMQLAHPAKPLILVEVHLNERGPFQFAVDTGTSTTTLSPRLARDLDLRAQPIGTVTTGGAPIAMNAARLGALRVGQAAGHDLDVLIGEFLEMLSQAIGRRLDGIVGYNFLRNFRVAIDYPNESFALFAAERDARPGSPA